MLCRKPLGSWLLLIPLSTGLVLELASSRLFIHLVPARDVLKRDKSGIHLCGSCHNSGFILRLGRERHTFFLGEHNVSVGEVLERGAVVAERAAPSMPTSSCPYGSLCWKHGPYSPSPFLQSQAHGRKMAVSLGRNTVAMFLRADLGLGNCSSEVPRLRTQ
jgi:hypothetical protein